MGIFFRKKKDKLAFWVVSHCETASQRELYVEAMQQFINVDVGVPYKKLE